jgi:hypothetical protein
MIGSKVTPKKLPTRLAHPPHRKEPHHAFKDSRLVGRCNQQCHTPYADRVTCMPRSHSTYCLHCPVLRQEPHCGPGTFSQSQSHLLHVARILTLCAPSVLTQQCNHEGNTFRLQPMKNTSNFTRTLLLRPIQPHQLSICHFNLAENSSINLDLQTACSCWHVRHQSTNMLLY